MSTNSVLETFRESRAGFIFANYFNWVANQFLKDSNSTIIISKIRKFKVAYFDFKYLIPCRKRIDWNTIFSGLFNFCSLQKGLDKWFYLFRCACRHPCLKTRCYYNIHGVQEKLCFFSINCTPSRLAYIAVRDLQSSQRIASVQSLLLAGNFLYNQ